MNISETIDFGKQRISFLQTDEWASINALFNKAQLLEIYDSNKAVSGYFFYKDTTPWYKAIIKKYIGRKSGIIEGHASPVFNDNCEKDNIAEFIENISNFAAKKNAAKIFITTNTFAIRHMIDHFISIAEEKGFAIKKTYNPIVDLRRSPQEISMGFKNAARTGARKAQSSGVTIKKCDDFEQYCNFIATSNNVKQNKMQDLQKYKKFWNNYSSKYTFFYSELNGIILSILGTYEHDKIVTPISSCVTHECLKLKIPAQDLLFWEVINHHKDKGNEFFELTPVTFEDEQLTEKEKGIRSFKLKWSQEFITQYYLELTL